MPRKLNVVCLFLILSATPVSLQTAYTRIVFLDCVNRILTWVILISSAHTHTHTNICVPQSSSVLLFGKDVNILFLYSSALFIV